MNIETVLLTIIWSLIGIVGGSLCWEKCWGEKSPLILMVICVVGGPIAVFAAFINYFIYKEN